MEFLLVFGRLDVHENGSRRCYFQATRPLVPAWSLMQAESMVDQLEGAAQPFVPGLKNDPS